MEQIIKVQDLELIVDEFKNKSGTLERYSSFDYCYNYFRTTENLNRDIEKSCLVLGFYLASWGMLRGSSFLLQKSAKHFQNLITYYNTLDKNTWQIDIDNYNDDINELIVEIYRKTKENIILNNNAHLTLITKILLGVFGFIPAYDQYFCKTFGSLFKGRCGFSVVNFNSLNCLKEFYDINKSTIDKLTANTYTKDFLTSNNTTINYPKAKIIDMYGFTNGLNIKQS